MVSILIVAVDLLLFLLDFLLKLDLCLQLLHLLCNQSILCFFSFIIYGFKQFWLITCKLIIIVFILYFLILKLISLIFLLFFFSFLKGLHLLFLFFFLFIISPKLIANIILSLSLSGIYQILFSPFLKISTSKHSTFHKLFFLMTLWSRFPCILTARLLDSTGIFNFLFQEWRNFINLRICFSFFSRTSKCLQQINCWFCMCFT